MTIEKIFNDLNRLQLTGKITYFGSAFIAARDCSTVWQSVSEYGAGILPLAIDTVGAGTLKSIAAITVAGLALDCVAGYAKKLDGSG